VQGPAKGRKKVSNRDITKKKKKKSYVLSQKKREKHRRAFLPVGEGFFHRGGEKKSAKDPDKVAKGGGVNRL